MNFFPGIKNPTDNDRVGLELADEQLQLIEDLRRIRIRRGLKVVDVAEAMGVDVSQVSRFESGSTNPTMSTIRRYANTVMAVFRIRTSKDCEARGVEAGPSFPLKLFTPPGREQRSDFSVADFTTYRPGVNS